MAIAIEAPTKAPTIGNPLKQVGAPKQLQSTSQPLLQELYLKMQTQSLQPEPSKQTHNLFF